MNYEEFLDYMKEQLEEVLGERDEGAKYDIQIHKIVKNNGIVLDGLVIRRGEEPVSPNIYLNSYFESYQMGRPIAAILEEIVLRYREVCKENAIDVMDLTDFNNVRDKIVLRLVNYEKNREMLKLCPNRRYLDLAVTFRYMVSKDSLGIASSLVSNAEFELWQVDLDELYHLALFNTMREFPWKMDSLAKVVTESIREQDMGMMPEELIKELEQMENGVNMYVLTNEYGINGATCILYDTVIQHFAKVQDCNIYVLPSSVHEVMLVPENAETEPEFLEELVTEANKSAVGLIDLLSDHIYYYDREHEQMCMYQ
ncbi:MAG: DUF5688 family protein [Clostridium sp.]|nr:DUF5688 family protein [Clostridium sp.]